jgi:hypothetical protein
MKNLVIRELNASKACISTECPFAIYDLILNAVTTYFDHALWGFRKPVRNIEKVYTNNLARLFLELTGSRGGYKAMRIGRQ